MSKNSSSSSNDQKSFHEIINRQISTGLSEHKRSRIGLFMSAITAGMEVGFSVLFMAVLYTLFHNEVSQSVLHVIISLAYSIGFIFVVIGRSELFTEHTVLSVLPVLNRKATILSLLKVWGIIYCGNLIGGYLFSLTATFIGPQMHTIDIESFEVLAKHMLQYDWHIILGSGVIAGWLMGTLNWLVTSAQDTISRLLLIIIVMFVIGLGGFHHCIVGSIEVFSGFITSKNITLVDYLSFQSAATLGNILGGCVFVAGLKFSHIATS